MRVMTLLLFIVLVFLGVSFATLNADIVKVNYYFGVGNLPVSLLIVGCVGVGLLLGAIFSLSKILRLKAENARLRQRVKMVEKEVENLRAIPLKNEH